MINVYFVCSSLKRWFQLRNNCRNARLHFQMTFSLPSRSCLLKLPDVHASMKTSNFERKFSPGYRHMICIEKSKSILLESQTMLSIQSVPHLFALFWIYRCYFC